jgi:Sugar (and other) transporter
MCEVVPPGLRGTLIDLHGVFVLLGYVTASWVGYGFFFWQDGAGGNQWRGPFGIFPASCSELY